MVRFRHGTQLRDTCLGERFQAILHLSLGLAIVLLAKVLTESPNDLLLDDVGHHPIRVFPSYHNRHLILVEQLTLIHHEAVLDGVDAGPWGTPTSSC